MRALLLCSCQLFPARFCVRNHDLGGLCWSEHRVGGYKEPLAGYVLALSKGIRKLETLIRKEMANIYFPAL